jgi:integrase
MNKHLPPRLRLSHGAYYWTPFVNGKQKWIPLGREFAEAFEKYGRLEADKHEASGSSFADLERRFFAEVVPLRAKNTQKSYRSWIKPLRATFGEVDVSKITQQSAAKYRDVRTHRTSANRELALLSTMLGYGVEIGMLPAPNPLVGFKHKPEARRTRYITDDELARLIGAAEPKLALLIRLAYLTGLRKSDLLSLRWQDVKPDGLYVTTQKTGVPLVLTITPELINILEALKRSQGKVMSLYLFAHRNGRKLNAVTADHHWMALRDSLGLDVVFHDIRRKRLTDATDAHGQEYAQRLAGHKEARTTARYYAPEAIRVDLAPTHRPPSGRKQAKD